MKYKMTIIMPSYNNGEYIRQSLDSILCQKVNFSYQIIVTDDCSQDDSPQIIREYEIKYPDKILALFSNKNCRLFRNVLKALEKMDSEYFCVLDPDDYWTDEKRLQKAVDFLDSNPEYTIYATNEYRIYNDGTVEMRYDCPDVDTCTSTYEDWLKGTERLSNTLASTYRNVYFCDGIPQEYLDLAGTESEEIFRADTARNLIHLQKGKGYFINESIGYSRYHGRGLYSSLTKLERHIIDAFGYLAIFNFFGRKNGEDFLRKIKGSYACVVDEYFQGAVTGNLPKLSEQCKGYLKTATKWLQDCGNMYMLFPVERFDEIAKMACGQIILWGAGNDAYRVIEKYHIPLRTDTFFVDNDSHKQGTMFLDRPVKAPEEISGKKDVLVIITSTYYKEIIKQIKEQKLCAEDKIVNLYDYEKNRSRILLV